MLVLFVFFFKQKTAYEMRISDWSSDVCSSDLGIRREFRGVILEADLPVLFGDSALGLGVPALGDRIRNLKRCVRPAQLFTRQRNFRLAERGTVRRLLDRKSTRLNSSH